MVKSQVIIPTTTVKLSHYFLQISYIKSTKTKPADDLEKKVHSNKYRED